MIDEAKKRGEDWEEIARAATTRCGCFQGAGLNEDWKDHDSLKSFAEVFADRWGHLYGQGLTYIESGHVKDLDAMAEANRITPLEMAERNKQYALFTTAILQNQLIDEFKKTNNITPDIKDLPGMEQIVLTVKDNPNPMLRASGLAALAYNARPEYKAVMKEIFELSKQDADENVRKVAEEGLAKLNTVADAPQTPAQAA